MQYVWYEEKNQIIKNQKGRIGIGFEDIEKAIINNAIVADDFNDNVNYAYQKMMIVMVNNYPFKVPYIELGNNTRKLITAYPYKKYRNI